MIPPNLWSTSEKELTMRCLLLSSQTTEFVSCFFFFLEAHKHGEKSSVILCQLNKSFADSQWKMVLLCIYFVIPKAESFFCVLTLVGNQIVDKRWSFNLNRFCRLGGFAIREKVFCFSLLFWVLLWGGKCLYTAILWVVILAPHCNTILLLIDEKKKICWLTMKEHPLSLIKM